MPKQAAQKGNGKGKPKGTPKIGLALAGGGPLGGVYEIGAMIALNEALEGVDFQDVDVLVGVSAGAMISATGSRPSSRCAAKIPATTPGTALEPRPMWNSCSAAPKLARIG